MPPAVLITSFHIFPVSQHRLQRPVISQANYPNDLIPHDMSIPRRRDVASPSPTTFSPLSGQESHWYQNPTAPAAQWNQALQQYTTLQFSASLASHKRLLRRLLALKSLSPSLSLLQSQLWFNMATIHASLGEYYLAIKEFKECINLNNRFIIGWYGLGIAYFMLRRYEEATTAFKDGMNAFNAEENDDETSGGMGMRNGTKVVTVDLFEISWNNSIMLDTNEMVAVVAKHKWHLLRESIEWNAKISENEMVKQEHKRYQTKGVSESIDHTWGLNGLPIGALFGPASNDILPTSVLDIEGHSNIGLQEAEEKPRPASPLRKESNRMTENEKITGREVDERDSQWKKPIKSKIAKHKALLLPPQASFSTRQWNQEGNQSHEMKTSK